MNDTKNINFKSVGMSIRYSHTFCLYMNVKTIKETNMRKMHIYLNGVFLFSVTLYYDCYVKEDDTKINCDLINSTIEHLDSVIAMCKKSINRYAITNPKDYQIRNIDTKYSDDQMVDYDGVLNYIERSVEDNFDLLEEYIIAKENLEWVAYNADKLTWENDY